MQNMKQSRYKQTRDKIIVKYISWNTPPPPKKSSENMIAREHAIDIYDFI